MKFFTSINKQTHYYDIGFKLFKRSTFIYFIGYNSNDTISWKDFIPCIEIDASGIHVGFYFGFVVGFQILHI